jgi:hypothetical protein
MQRDQRRVGLFHHPIYARLRKSAADIARNRQVVDDVPERGGLDEEDLEHGASAMRRSDSG